MRRSAPEFPFDIQFFGQERTEPATPHKRDKIRKEGRVCTSKDLSAAVEILTGLLGILVLGPITCGALLELITFSVRFMGDQALLQDGWLYLLSWEAIKDYFLSWLPLGALIALFAVATLVCQVGFAMTGEPFKPNFGRLNPISGMKKIISLRSIVELLKGLLKCSLFAIVIYTAIRNYLPVASKTMQMPLEVGSAAFWDMLWTLAMRLAMMLLVMAFVDYLYQKWEFERSIRMSKQEIKEEYKQMEGDPQVKSKIRQKQREMAKNRMMADVPKADVVITNPTTLAIALSYDRAIMGAPQVVAKGRGYLAQRIRELAQASKVPVIENKPLAWALYEGVEVGEEIPEDLYRGVAEILAMVYRLRAS
ncbi:MAG: flagellar biosynthesis protein FlhB [Synergistaceae bacterium]|nr:flagellar biosynthesis protein FlhB [Synergistaceae bacterium]